MSGDTIARVAALIIRGRIVHATEAHDGLWGVLPAERVLDSLRDATSDAWSRGTGPSSPPKRYTREDAETHARRLTGSSYDGSQYVAAEFPAHRCLATIGPFAVNGLPVGSRWACLDWTQAGAVCDTGDDWSAFAAADAFVAMLGDRIAEAACDAAEVTP